MASRSFLIYRPDGSSAPCSLQRPLIRIGRGEDNDIILEDPSRSISRFHAQIVLNPDGRSILADLKSANGTFVNEQILDGPVALAQDDVVRIGPYRLVFRDSFIQRPKTQPPPLPAFQIEAAAVELDQLQDRPHLLAPSESETVASSPQLHALELLHEVGVRLARTVTAADVAETALDLLFKISGVDVLGRFPASLPPGRPLRPRRKEDD
jgi:pSer/pThr/pTyr-binding forkhead associated (FHA) protein